MYLEYFKLKKLPFVNTPDLSCFFSAKTVQSVLLKVEYLLVNNESVVVICGPPGSGKTIFCKKLIHELGGGVSVASILQPQLDDVGLLESLLNEFGIDSKGMSKQSMLNAINENILNGYSEGKKTVIIIDDAHCLQDSALEELRLIGKLQTENNNIVHIVLLGTENLEKRLNSDKFTSFRQHVSFINRLEPLSVVETKRYIQHRLTCAKGYEDNDMFETDAIPLLYIYTGGVPRLINHVASAALTTVFAEGNKVITKSVIQTVIEELALKPYGEALLESVESEKVEGEELLSIVRTFSKSVEEFSQSVIKLEKNLDKLKNS